jgi:hypothetical protein
MMTGARLVRCAPGEPSAGVTFLLGETHCGIRYLGYLGYLIWPTPWPHPLRC